MRSRKFQGPRSRSRRHLLGDERGAVSVEYMAVWGFTVIAIAVAIIGIGPALNKAWPMTQKTLMANKP